MSSLLRNAAVGAAATALLMVPTANAVAATGATDIVNGETVVADLSPSGAVEGARLISQLTVAGDGRVVIADPVSGKGLRNLDGFSTPSMKDGKALYTIEVEGVARRRTVSDFDRKLPITVKAEYLLDGKRSKAEDLVGRSGDLEVRYTVANVSGTPTAVSWKNGNGVSQTKTVDLVTPLVGQLTTDLPPAFSEIEAPAADIAANGRGGSHLSFSMVLFPPIGQPVQSFGYTARLMDGVLPPAQVQVVPVSPTVKPELAAGARSYRDGAAQAAQLTVGAGQIDANLLKLQNGASELLAGLTKLAAGAVQLQTGLAGQLSPGAAKLAAGADAAHTGSSQLKEGVDKLAAGADELATGLGSAADGSVDLAEGIEAILDGVRDLPAALTDDPGYQQLLGALTAVKAGIGSPTDVSATTVLGGLNLLRYGLRSPLGVSGCDQEATPGSATACGAADAVQLVQDQLAAAAASGGQLDQLVGAARAGYAAAACPAVPSGVVVPVSGVLPPSTSGLTATCVYLSSLAYGLGLPAGVDVANPLGGVKAQTVLAAGVLRAVYQGIDDRILPGISGLKAAMSNPACSLTNPQNPSNPCGIHQVQSLVAAGIATLVTQISAQLSAFLSTAADGASELAAGTELLAAGGVQLADGSKAAAVGAGSLDSGLGQVESGAGQLKVGVDKAAAGAGEIAQGLEQAKAGDSKVVAGAGELREKGTKPLVKAGNETASENALKYATLVALGEKVAQGALPYGAPDGGTGTAAYSLVLSGADSGTQENLTRGLVAAALLGLALAGSGLIRRRRVG